MQVTPVILKRIFIPKSKDFFQPQKQTKTSPCQDLAELLNFFWQWHKRKKNSRVSPDILSFFQAQQIPFEVTKANVHNFEKLFDPSYGYNLKETKMVNWITKQLS